MLALFLVWYIPFDHRIIGGIADGQRERCCRDNDVGVSFFNQSVENPRGDLSGKAGEQIKRRIIVPVTQAPRVIVHACRPWKMCDKGSTGWVLVDSVV